LNYDAINRRDLKESQDRRHSSPRFGGGHFPSDQIMHRSDGMSGQKTRGKAGLDRRESRSARFDVRLALEQDVQNDVDVE